MSEIVSEIVGGLRYSLMALFLGVPPVFVAIALSCQQFWRTPGGPRPARVFAVQRATSR
jgi:hypothetical protein